MLVFKPKRLREGMLLGKTEIGLDGQTAKYIKNILFFIGKVLVNSCIFHGEFRVV